MSNMSDLRSRAEKMRQEFFNEDNHKDWFADKNIFTDEKSQNFFNDERRPDFFQKHEFINNSKRENFFQRSKGDIDEFEKLKQRMLDKRSFPWDYEWEGRGNVRIKRNDHKSQKSEETISKSKDRKGTDDDVDDITVIPNGQRRRSLDNLFSKIRDLKCEFQNVEKKLRNAREALPHEYRDAASEQGLHRGQRQEDFNNIETQSSRSWIRRPPEEDNISWRSERKVNHHDISRTNRDVTTQTHTPAHDNPTQPDEKQTYRATSNYTRKPYIPTYDDTKQPYTPTVDNTKKPYRYTYDDTKKPYRPNYNNIKHPNSSTYDGTKMTNATINDKTKQTYGPSFNDGNECERPNVGARRKILSNSEYYPGKISGEPPPPTRSNKAYGNTTQEQTGTPVHIYQIPQQENKMIPVKINLVQTIVKDNSELKKPIKEGEKEEEGRKDDVETIIAHNPSALQCSLKQSTNKRDECASTVSSPTYPFLSDGNSCTATSPQASIHATASSKEPENTSAAYPFPEYDGKDRSPSSYTDYTEMYSGVSSPMYGMGTATEPSETYSGVSSPMYGMGTATELSETYSGVSSPMYGIGTATEHSETYSGVSSPTYGMGTVTELSETYSGVSSPTYGMDTVTELSETHSGVSSPSYVVGTSSEHSELESTYKTASDGSASQPTNFSSRSEPSTESETSASYIDSIGNVTVLQKEEDENPLRVDVTQTKVISVNPEYVDTVSNRNKQESSSEIHEKNLEESSFNPEQFIKNLLLNPEKKESLPINRKKKDYLLLNPKKAEQPSVIPLKIEQSPVNFKKTEHSSFNPEKKEQPLFNHENAQNSSLNLEKTRKYSPDPGYNSNSSSSTIRAPSLCHSETYVQIPVVHSGDKGRVEVEKRITGDWKVSWTTVVREQQVTWDTNNVMDGNNRIRMGEDQFGWTATEYIYQN